jgi:hypothetical protein
VRRELLDGEERVVLLNAMEEGPMEGRHRIRGRANAATLALAVLIGAACSDDSDEPEAGRAVLPDEVVCNLAFRPNLRIPPIEEAEVRVPRGDRLGGALVEHEIGTMTFNVAYDGDIPDGRTVHASVFGADDALIVSVLYQIGDDFPATTYLGGFGFTGLHYAYDGEAELQFWCEAE